MNENINVTVENNEITVTVQPVVEPVVVVSGANLTELINKREDLLTQRTSIQTNWDNANIQFQKELDANQANTDINEYAIEQAELQGATENNVE